jgi:hypothetical protein
LYPVVLYMYDVYIYAYIHAYMHAYILESGRPVYVYIHRLDLYTCIHKKHV